MATEIPNPVRWYYQRDAEAEWWHRAGETRDEAIAKGRADYPDEDFWIAQCKLMVPNLSVFDGDDICERINDDDEAWWEDGWTGEPDAKAKRELERRLEATLTQWFAEFASLDGAGLDQISSEKIAAETPNPSQGQTNDQG